MVGLLKNKFKKFTRNKNFCLNEDQNSSNILSITMKYQENNLNCWWQVIQQIIS
jgi:hypothetical protein